MVVDEEGDLFICVSLVAWGGWRWRGYFIGYLLSLLLLLMRDLREEVTRTFHSPVWRGKA
jgi:hypothetical protein